MKKQLLLVSAALLCTNCAPYQAQMAPAVSRSPQGQQISQQPAEHDYKDMLDQQVPKEENSFAPDRRDWYHIGSAEGYAYYVDVSREMVKGSYWSAPALVIARDNTKTLGKFLLDCSTLEYKTQLANFESDWAKVGAGSPLSSVAENVCVSQ